MCTEQAGKKDYKCTIYSSDFLRPKTNRHRPYFKLDEVSQCFFEETDQQQAINRWKTNRQLTNKIRD